MRRTTSRSSLNTGCEHSARPIAAGWFLLRTPLISFDEWMKWTRVANMGINYDSPDVIDPDCLVEQKNRLRQSLRDWLTPVVNEALYLSTPTFYRALVDCASSSESKRSSKIESKLVSFFARMSGRCVPFGLSAGITFGETGSTTSLSLVSQAGYLRHTHLDIRFLLSLVGELTGRGLAQQSASFKPNSTLYTKGNQIRYFETQQIRRRRIWNTARLVACKQTPELTAVLKRAQRGATRGELAAMIASSEDDLNEAQRFIGKLIHSQIIVSDLEPTISGPDPLAQVIDGLGGGDTFQTVKEELSELREALNRIDSQPLGIPIEHYTSLVNKAAAIMPSLVVDDARLLHVDLVKPAREATIGQNVLSELAQA